MFNTSRIIIVIHIIITIYTTAATRALDTSSCYNCKMSLCGIKRRWSHSTHTIYYDTSDGSSTNIQYGRIAQHNNIIIYIIYCVVVAQTVGIIMHRVK